MFAEGFHKISRLSRFARLARALGSPHVPAFAATPASMRCLLMASSSSARIANLHLQVTNTGARRAFSFAATDHVDDKRTLSDYEDVQSLVAQLDALLPAADWKPSPLYSINPDGFTRARYAEALDKYTAVIDDPRTKLKYEFLGDIKPHAQLCLDVAAETPNARFKQLIATVCGPGGGKTRLLEELRLALLQRKERDVIPLVFTFNVGMNLGYEENEYLTGAVPKVRYAFAVIKRLLGVFYGKPINTVHHTLAPGGQTLKLRSRTGVHDSDLALNLIRATIVHIFRAVNRQRGQLHNQPRATTLVVMQDESMSADVVFATQDLAATLRSALLDEVLDQHLNVALVMTALGPSAFKSQRVSDRSLAAIRPPRLSADDVLRRWWGILRDDDEQVPQTTLAMARLVAAAVKDLPRQVEIFCQQIHKMGLARPGALWDEKHVKRLFEVCKELLRSRYGSDCIVTTQQLNNIVFHTEVAVTDSETQAALSQSVYLNVLKRFHAGTIYPEASLVFLSAIAEGSMPGGEPPSTASSAPAAAAAAAGIRTRTALEALDAFLQDMPLKSPGRPLEWSLEWWLELRLALLAELRPQQSFSLLELLGLKNKNTFADKLWPQSLTAFKNLEFQVAEPVVFSKPLRQSIRGGQGIDAFINELAACLLLAGKKKPILFSPRRGDPFDLLLVVRDNTQSPFVVFFECKARAPATTTPSSKFSLKQALEVLGRLAACRQHMRAGPGAVAGGGSGPTLSVLGSPQTPMVDVVPSTLGNAVQQQMAAASPPSGSQPTKEDQVQLLRAAIVAGRYAFVFVRTEAGETRVPDLPEREDYPVVDMCRDSTEGFFGPLWCVHEALRSGAHQLAAAQASP